MLFASKYNVNDHARHSRTRATSVSIGRGDMWKKKVTRGAAKVHEHTTFDVAPAQDSTERRKKDTVCTCAELLLLLFPRSSDVIYIATCVIFRGEYTAT